MNAVTPVIPAGLLQSVERARALLDEGDYVAARLLSAGAYEQAKAAVDHAQRVKASDRLIAKAREMQLSALEIEAMATVGLADEVDAAQAAGLISARGGRPKTVAGGDGFRIADLGVTRQQLHEARRLREVVRQMPDFVRVTLGERIKAGLSPTRANLRAAIGTASAGKADRGDNLYQTPPEATLSLLALERFSDLVWEPACGRGAIARVLEASGYQLRLSDLRDYGTQSEDGTAQEVGNFLASRAPEGGAGPDIVTNPPYGEDLNRFVAHALREHRPRKMALLLNLNVICGYADPDRTFWMEDHPPARVYAFKHRLPMMHRDGWEGEKASSRMNTGWFVWERQEDGSYGRSTLLHRIDWEDFAGRDPLSPNYAGAFGRASFVDVDAEDFTRQTPRRTLAESVEAVREQVRAWLAAARGQGRTQLDRRTLRQQLGIRDATAIALIDEFCAVGLLGPADDGGAHPILDWGSDAA
ncbi:hypothetical protein BJF92_12095 [Rhizobium rhizosphaerae]|uniref:SAM-dependent methyltransferase n=1 Tax=Xaviernesmea rhizosphaerae TaxID=1672749 RepID=A0A1Q9AN96_9HYPH|nr:hypothetical protein [Xaviernesmea rhizosphaerae]OLP56806.1 hypothetical protein BJF92_12095 [Xaviernesmea rhizosphaerae]